MKDTFHKTGTEFTSRTKEELESADWLKHCLSQSIDEMGSKWDVHLPLFLSAASLARLLWLDTIYRKAIDVPGCLVEFGSQWGASMNTFLLLKQIHEPWNASRKILSFSIFEEGFKAVDAEDGHAAKEGDYGVAAGWDKTLERVLAEHAQRSPIGATNNFEIIPGDAVENFTQYLDNHPELILSHVHFDMDLYKPTRDLIKICVERMPKGAVIIFDELNCPPFPGETVAINEVLSISSLRLRKSTYQPYSAYAIIGE